MSATVTSISPTILSNSTNASSGTTSLPTQTLTQQDFLNLLVAQMTAQDPMNPQTNTDFAAQMAQFTALQTAQNTQSAVTQLHSDQQLDQANALLGRTVTLQTSSGGNATGVVSSIQMVQGVPQLMVNGNLYDLSQVTAIAPPISIQQMAQQQKH